MNILRKYGDKLNYDVFMIFLVVLSLGRYTGIINISYFVILSFLAIFVVLSGKSILYLLSLGAISLMSFSDGMDFVEMSKIYSIIMGVLLIIDFILNRSIRSIGKLSMPLFLLVFSSLISYFFAKEQLHAIYSILIILSYLLGYMYLYTSLEKGDESIAIKMVSYLSILVTLELIFVLISNSDARLLLTTDRASFPAGWENLNIVVFVNLVAIPFAIYQLYKFKYRARDIVVLVLITIGPILTLSRSTILTVLVYYGLAMLFLLSRKFNLKKSIVFGSIGTVVVIGIVVTANWVGLIQLPERFTSGLFFLGDRLEVFKAGINAFASSPIFGTGGIYSSRFYLSDLGWYNYHNTILQATTLGVVGVGLLSYLFVQKYKIVSSSSSEIRWVVWVMILVTSFINGFLQPMYFNANYMVYMLVFLVITELQYKND